MQNFARLDKIPTNIAAAGPQGGRGGYLVETNARKAPMVPPSQWATRSPFFFPTKKWGGGREDQPNVIAWGRRRSMENEGVAHEAAKRGS